MSKYEFCYSINKFVYKRNTSWFVQVLPASTRASQTDGKDGRKPLIESWFTTEKHDPQFRFGILSLNLELTCMVNCLSLSPMKKKKKSFWPPSSKDYGRTTISFVSSIGECSWLPSNHVIELMNQHRMRIIILHTHAHRAHTHTHAHAHTHTHTIRARTERLRKVNTSTSTLDDFHAMVMDTYDTVCKLKSQLGGSFLKICKFR